MKGNYNSHSPLNLIVMILFPMLQMIFEYSLVVDVALVDMRENYEKDFKKLMAYYEIEGSMTINEEVRLLLQVSQDIQPPRYKDPAKFSPLVEIKDVSDCPTNSS